MALPLSTNRPETSGEPVVWPMTIETSTGFAPAVLHVIPPVAWAGTAAASRNGSKRKAFFMPTVCAGLAEPQLERLVAPR